MYRNIKFVLATLVVYGIGAVTSMAASDLTLRDALNRALDKNPELAAANAEYLASESIADQEGTIPNPELELEVEELGAPGGSDALATTLSITQDFELAGKRRKRRHAALLEAKVSKAASQIKVLDLKADVTMAFIEAQASFQKAKLQDEVVAIATQAFETVAARVKAGKVSPIEQTQARVQMTGSRIEQRKSWAQWQTARSALAATWGGTGEDILAVQNMPDNLPPPPAAETLRERLAKSPDLLRLDAEIAAAEAIVELERANKIPDLALTGGVSTVGGDDETTYMVGVSMAIPVFNRNGGAVSAAAANVTRNRAEKKAAGRGLQAELEATFHEMTAAREEVDALIGSMLPDSREAYEAIREGYNFGKFEYLVLLDAQRTLLETRTQFVEARAAYHLALVKLERMTAQY